MSMLYLAEHVRQARAGEPPPRPWELEAEHATIDARATRAFEIRGPADGREKAGRVIQEHLKA